MSTRLARAAACVGLTAILGFTVAGPASAADQTSEGDLRVQVIASDPRDPAPLGPPTAGGTTPISSSSRGPQASLPSDVSSGVPVATVDEAGIEGVVFVGGLTTSTEPSVNPLGGTVTASFTVRNVSSSTFDASASFELVGPFGNSLDVVDVAVDGLEPGKTRIVRAELQGPGQWAFLTARGTLTPPAKVDDIETTPIEREASLFVVPWLTTTLIVGGSAGFLVMRRLRTLPAAVPAGAPA